MSQRSGKITVTTENIFPIIRKWLYTDHDIFVRELVSNAIDAISKHKKLIDIGHIQMDGEATYRVDVIFDEKKKTIVFKDNGIGMTGDEIEKYINQIAFSGAMDFIEQHKAASVEPTDIIGHFGLGFYSAFMVADKVQIETKSYLENEPAVQWISTDGMEYTIEPSEKKQRSTEITLFLSDEAKKMFDATALRAALKKYCSFVPYELFFTDIEQEKRREKEDAKKKKEALEKDETFEQQAYEQKPINDTKPLWVKAPKDCTREEYVSFYHRVFTDMREPLFWIHLNMDYPFHLQGILYFPKMEHAYESLEGRIKIYNRQVFVADNMQDIIPDFLFLLRGCLDCTDLPLNVSRSALQQDAYVKKLSTHIVRKVSDKLKSLYDKDRSAFEVYWQDISLFVKYGMMKDDKFFEKVKPICLFKTIDNRFVTLEELCKDKDEIFYTTDPDRQAVYVDMAKGKGYDVVLLNDELDNNFISFLEYKGHDAKFKFMRVDARLDGESGDEAQAQPLQALFKEATGDDHLDITVLALGPDQLPAFIRETEEARRMKEMRQQFERMRTGQEDDPYKDLDQMFPEKRDLVLNADHPLMIRLRGLFDVEEEKSEIYRLAQHLYDQARLGHGSLDAEGLKRFLKVNAEMMTQFSEDL